MTDYPTRAEIDAARETIEMLQTYVERGAPLWGATWSGLETAREILAYPDAFPGLHYPAAEPEPEPEPKPTAAEVLEAAWLKADDGSAHESILYAALRYAQTNPEWFANWHAYTSTAYALSDAAGAAGAAGEVIADKVLTAAQFVAADHPHLFGGAA